MFLLSKGWSTSREKNCFKQEANNKKLWAYLLCRVNFIELLCASNYAGSGLETEPGSRTGWSAFFRAQSWTQKKTRYKLSFEPSAKQPSVLFTTSFISIWHIQNHQTCIVIVCHTMSFRCLKEAPDVRLKEKKWSCEHESNPDLRHYFQQNFKNICTSEAEVFLGLLSVTLGAENKAPVQWSFVAGGFEVAAFVDITFQMNEQGTNFTLMSGFFSRKMLGTR